MTYIDALHAVVLGMQVSASLACLVTCVSMLLTGSGDPAVYLPVLAGVVGYWMPSPARVTYVTGCVMDDNDACSASDSVSDSVQPSDQEGNEEEEEEAEEDEEDMDDDEAEDAEDAASSVDTPDLIRFTDDERVPLLMPRDLRDDDDDGVLGPLEDVD